LETSDRKQNLFLTILITGLTILVLVIGFLSGRFSVTRELREAIDGLDEGVTLNRMEGAASVTAAYYRPDEILRQLDQISWAVMNAPSPFVENAPLPGSRYNTVINRQQLRADHDLVIPKPSGLFRIFITGGSTAYGSGAPSRETTIAGYLETRLNKHLSPSTGLKYEVLTAANPAWASTHERIFIENRLSEWEPDLVIAFSGNNDVHWGYYGEDIFWFWSYHDRNLQKIIDRAYELSGLEVPDDVAPMGSSPVPPDMVAGRLKKNVLLSAFALNLSGAGFIFCLQPTLAVEKKTLTGREKRILSHWRPEQRDYFHRCYNHIRAALTDVPLENFQFLDVSDTFEGSGEDIYLDAYHFGDRGNDRLAEALFEGLRGLMVRP
jgi:hypothetical protein